MENYESLKQELLEFIECMESDLTVIENLKISKTQMLENIINDLKELI